jgi:L-fuculose-phosphate aldolase
MTSENIRHHDVVGQDRHGVTAKAKSPWDAFEHIERLEHICQIVLASGLRPDEI